MRGLPRAGPRSFRRFMPLVTREAYVYDGQRSPRGDMSMLKRDVLDKLTAHREEWRRFSVKSLAIFGSVARGEAKESSDGCSEG